MFERKESYSPHQLFLTTIRDSASVQYVQKEQFMWLSFRIAFGLLAVQFSCCISHSMHFLNELQNLNQSSKYVYRQVGFHIQRICLDAKVVIIHKMTKIQYGSAINFLTRLRVLEPCRSEERVIKCGQKSCKLCDPVSDMITAGGAVSCAVWQSNGLFKWINRILNGSTEYYFITIK